MLRALTIGMKTLTILERELLRRWAEQATELGYQIAPWEFLIVDAQEGAVKSLHAVKSLLSGDMETKETMK